MHRVGFIFNISANIFSAYFDYHNISLELRVKEKLLRYPEEIFFDSQGIPAKPY